LIAVKIVVFGLLNGTVWGGMTSIKRASLFAIVKMAYANAKEFQSKVQIFASNAQGC